MIIKATKVSREEEERIFAELAGDLTDRRRKELTDRILMSVYPLIVKYAGRVRGTRAPFDDLTQAGVLGAMHALTKFDPSKGFRFSTYADAWIKDHMWKLAAQERTILSASGLSSSDPDGSAKLDIRVAYPDGDLEERDPLTADDFDVEQVIEDLRNLDKLDDWIRKAALTTQERIVLERVYQGSESLADIGRDLNLTRARIWQVHEKALGKLRVEAEKEEET